MSEFKVENSIDVESLVNPYFNVGQIISTIATSAPSGWLLCDGSEHSKTGQYSNLYSKIGIRYGEGNGSGGVGTSHFKLPDLRGKHIMSFQIGAAASGGSSTHTHTVNTHATAANVAVNHYHSVGGISALDTGGGYSNTYHSHSGGDSYVGPNGSNPVNANKTGTGGSGYGSGGAHVHDGYSYGNTNADNGLHSHNMVDVGINNQTAGNHSHTSISTISGSASSGNYQIPSYTVNFVIKV